MIQLKSIRNWPAVCLLVLCSLALGCGEDKGYRVSGKVSFMGKPVPAGKIYFMPDGSKANSGATGFADIKDGLYDTALPGGHGSPGGAVIIAIVGNDPTGTLDKNASPDVTTKLLFARYETPAELPKAVSTKDIDVPADAAKGPKQPKTGNVVVP